MKKVKTPRCRRCGRTVGKCDYKPYKYSCDYCDEDLFSFEVYFENNEKEK